MLLDEVRLRWPETRHQVNAATLHHLITPYLNRHRRFRHTRQAVTQFWAPLGGLRRLLTGAPSEISIRNRTTTRKQKERKTNHDYPEPGELLWDMLPSGKRNGGAPVNFAYHAMKNGTEGWAISAVGEDANSATN